MEGEPRTSPRMEQDITALIDEVFMDFMSSTSPPCTKRRKLSCASGGAFGGMRINFGRNIDDAAAILPRHNHKDLLLGKDYAARLKNAEFRKMQQNRKLYLVLDLDHTLLNSTHFKDISPDEEYLMNQPPHTLHDGNLFRLDQIEMVTKLRPFVRRFLKEASDLFEMYIYTMGNKLYAHEMAKLLDPEGSYFQSRIISKEDSTEKNKKGLDVVLPGMDSAVVVLDDTLRVWEKHKENVIVVGKYNYFHKSHRSCKLPGKSLSEMKIDEPEEGGLLATMLGVLRRVHRSFFERGDEIAVRDVREVLKAMKKEVLKDCKMVFSHIVPQGGCCRDNLHWKMAEELGATCCEEADSSVTHVVSLHPGTNKSIWALENNKLLVHPKWIHAAFYWWKRLPEDKFPVIDDNKH